MNVSHELINLLERLAPALATQLVGPIGEALASTIASYFNADKSDIPDLVIKISHDANKQYKLNEIETSILPQLLKLPASAVVNLRVVDIEESKG